MVFETDVVEFGQQVGQNPVEQVPEEQEFGSVALEEELPREKAVGSFFTLVLPQAGHCGSA
jgi:hypothetical protein